MEKYTKLYSATVLGTGNNNGIYLDAGAEYVFKSYYRLRVKGENALRLFFVNSIESTGCFNAGDLGGEYEIVKAYASYGAVSGEESGKTEITFGGNKNKKVLKGEQFSSDFFSFDAKEKYLILTFVVKAEETILLPTTNESASTGRIWKNGVEIPSDAHALRPCFIGAEKKFNKTIGFMGDSITQGTRIKENSYESWVHRIGMAADESVSVWNIGMGWSRAYDAASGGVFLEKAAMCDEVYICFGVNDLRAGGRSAEELTCDLKETKRLLEEKNKRIKAHFLTVPPFNMEKDEERERQKVNRYIRQTEEYFDIAAVLEDGNEGKVKKEYMADSTDSHPNEKAGEAIFKSFTAWETKMKTKRGKRMKQKFVLWCLVICVMAVIFNFSSQPKDESNETSRTFAYKVLSLSEAFRDMPEAEQEELITSTQKLFRKGAHFSIYALLGFLIYAGLGLKGKKRLIAAPVIAASYAATDETHQLFVSGRSGQASDVLLDFCGAVVGTLLGMMITAAIGEIIKRKKGRVQVG